MLANFFQCTLTSVFQSKTQFQYFTFTAAQSAQYFVQFFTQQRKGSRVCRSRGITEKIT